MKLKYKKLNARKMITITLPDEYPFDGRDVDGALVRVRTIGHSDDVQALRTQLKEISKDLTAAGAALVIKESPKFVNQKTVKEFTKTNNLSVVDAIKKYMIEHPPPSHVKTRVYELLKEIV
jgi:citrate lyase alpha subunit